METIIKMIEEDSWDKALELFPHIYENKALDETGFIIGASLMEHYRQWDTMFELIRNGLEQYPSNYELYILLGNYYMIDNPAQAYISYENALYHCINSSEPHSEDITAITQLLNSCKENNTIKVNNVSFVILSYNTLDYTRSCIESIRQTCYSECLEIIIIDNASTDGSLEWLRDQKDIILIENKVNLGFPAGCNQGIKAACSENDIFLLNSDTIMLAQSLFWLRIGLYSNDNIGAVGAGTDQAGNNQIIDKQFNSLNELITFCSKLNSPSLHPYELKAYLVMFALLIRRDALNKTGLLDERFSPGNYEDNDYGLRLMKNGYISILCHNSYIHHFRSKSFGKKLDDYQNLIRINHEKFKDKWGFYDDHYTHARNDIISMLDMNSDEEISILEVGCGLGETLAKILYLFPNAKVQGIETSEKIASIGNQRLDIKYGTIETIAPDNSKYSCIILSDVLDHLIHPEEVLIRLKNSLIKQGFVIAGFNNLLTSSGNNPNYFSLDKIKYLFANSGYRITQIATVTYASDSTEFGYIIKASPVL